MAGTVVTIRKDSGAGTQMPCMRSTTHVHCAMPTCRDSFQALWGDPRVLGGFFLAGLSRASVWGCQRSFAVGETEVISGRLDLRAPLWYRLAGCRIRMPASLQGYGIEIWLTIIEKEISGKSEMVTHPGSLPVKLYWHLRPCRSVVV